MFTKMACARGHDLPAPYFFLQIHSHGNLGPDIADAWKQFSAWSAVAQGNLRPDGYYFCADDFFELLGLMEAWRTGGLAGAKAWCEQGAEVQGSGGARGQGGKGAEEQGRR